MIFLDEGIFEDDGFKDGSGILIIKDSKYVDLLMIDEEYDVLEKEYDIDLFTFFKENGYDLDELWSEGYNIYYGFIRERIFEIQVNLSLPS